MTGGVEWFMRRREERQTARALARAIFAELLDMKGKCGYCAERGDWTLVDEPFELPIVWKDNELALARLLTWDQWVGLQAIRASQLGMRMLAGLAMTDPALNQSHLPTVTDVAIETIDAALPAFERLRPRARSSRRRLHESVLTVSMSAKGGLFRSDRMRVSRIVSRSRSYVRQ